MSRYTVRITLIEIGDTPQERRQVASEELPPLTNPTDAQTVYTKTVNAAVMHHAHVIHEGR